VIVSITCSRLKPQEYNQNLRRPFTTSSQGIAQILTLSRNRSFRPRLSPSPAPNDHCNKQDRAIPYQTTRGRYGRFRVTADIASSLARPLAINSSASLGAPRASPSSRTLAAHLFQRVCVNQRICGFSGSKSNACDTDSRRRADLTEVLRQDQVRRESRKSLSSTRKAVSGSQRSATAVSISP